jgi:hypothetical protein
MELVVVFLTKRDLEPRYVILTAGMVLFDVLISTTNETKTIRPGLILHDCAPIAT